MAVNAHVNLGKLNAAVTSTQTQYVLQRKHQTSRHAFALQAGKTLGGFMSTSGPQRRCDGVVDVSRPPLGSKSTRKDRSFVFHLSPSTTLARSLREAGRQRTFTRIYVSSGTFLCISRTSGRRGPALGVKLSLRSIDPWCDGGHEIVYYAYGVASTICVIPLSPRCNR